MTITQLEYVVAVATYKSFVAAAEKTYVTQPTLSMQIQKLEEELDIIIFDRSKHPIAITEIGEAVVEQAKKVLAEHARVNELIEQMHNTLTGTFRLGVIPTVAPYIMPSLLKNYSESFPDIRLVVREMQTHQIIAALRAGEIEVGLLSTPLEEKDKDIETVPLFEEPLVGYFSTDEPALQKRTITKNDVVLERIWLLTEGNCLRNQVLELCNDHIEKIQSARPYRYHSSNVDTLTKMVDKNTGLTILPELATLDFNDEQAERVRYFDDEIPVREISLVTTKYFVRKSFLTSLQQAILQLIPEKMRIQTRNRRVLRIQSAKL